MRPLEIALGGIAIATALSSLFERGKTAAWLLSAMAVGVLAAHWIREGPRLMAIPIYLAVCVLIISRVFPLPRAFEYFVLSAAAAGAIIGLIACYRIPVISFPEPPGPFAIGTQSFYFTDPGRVEEFAVTPGQHRRFAAQIWYPALLTQGAAAPYRDTKALSWGTAHLRCVKTHAHTDAPPVQTPARFPVVFFSPASGGYRSQNTYFTEFLVSYGYIVVGFDHPDTCSRVSFPDGSVMKGLPDAWLNLESRAALERSTIKTEKILNSNVQDMEFVFGQLLRRTADNRLNTLADHMDLSRVAAVGHSFGGAAAAELCRIDPRFRAGVNMDGWMFSGVVKYGIPRPFLFLIEDDPLWFKNEGPYSDNFDGMVRWGTFQYHQCIRNDVSLHGGQVARLLHATHPDFSDQALLKNPWPWAAKRAVPIKTLHAAVSRLVLAFLDETLKERENSVASAEAELRYYFQFGTSTT